MSLLEQAADIVEEFLQTISYRETSFFISYKSISNIISHFMYHSI